MMSWQLRHLIAGKLLRLAIFVLPDSSFKDALIDVLNEWGRHVLAALKQTHTPG